MIGNSYKSKAQFFMQPFRSKIHVQAQLPYKIFLLVNLVFFQVVSFFAGIAIQNNAYCATLPLFSSQCFYVDYPVFTLMNPITYISSYVSQAFASGFVNQFGAAIRFCFSMVNVSVLLSFIFVVSTAAYFDRLHNLTKIIRRLVQKCGTFYIILFIGTQLPFFLVMTLVDYLVYEEICHIKTLRFFFSDEFRQNAQRIFKLDESSFKIRRGSGNEEFPDVNTSKNKRDEKKEEQMDEDEEEKKSLLGNKIKNM